MFIYAAISLIILQLVSAQNHSPCPDVFVYEKGGSELDRWYGRINLTTDEALFGVWLRIGLDRPAELLGNWFAESTSQNNQDYLITNRQYRLEPYRPVSIRFFVKYNPEGSIPMLETIRLNGKTLCSSTVEEIITSTTTATTKLYVTDAKIDTTMNDPPPSNNKKPPKKTQGNLDEDLILSRVPALSVEEEKCGIRKVPAQPLITYGQSTIEGEWPWHAAIYRSKGITFQYVCGGSLISPKHILTAAICVTVPKTATPFNEDLFIVYLGKHSLYRLGPNVQNNGVKKISVHPEYDATRLYNNVAVLHLESPAEISDFVRTVCLWEEDISLNSIAGKLGTMVGWGYNQNATITENLMQATMPIVSTETCIFSNQDFFSIFTSETTYCAGFRNGTSACVGDSGGGMVFAKTDSKDQNTVWQLRGIVSVTAAANTKIICDTSSYIVFTDVAKHLEWIRNAMRS